MHKPKFEIKSPQDVLDQLARLGVTPHKWSVDRGNLSNAFCMCRFITKDGETTSSVVNFFPREIHFGVEYIPSKKHFRVSFLIPTIHIR